MRSLLALGLSVFCLEVATPYCEADESPANVLVPITVPTLQQKKSGLCWIFAALNLLESDRDQLSTDYRALFKVLRHAMKARRLTQFLDHVDVVLENDDVCMHSAELALSKSSISEFVDEIHALGAKYRGRALKEQSLLPVDQLKSTRWLLVFAPYQTNWGQYSIPL